MLVYRQGSKKTGPSGTTSYTELLVGTAVTNLSGVFYGLVDIGCDAASVVEYVNNTAFSCLYYYIRIETFKPHYEAYLQTTNNLVSGVEYLFTKYDQIPSDVRKKYDETMDEYWKLKNADKNIEAGELAGPACKDIVLTVFGGVGAGK